MPALLAYLVSLVVFIGTGYGALQWLAAPVPVRTVAVAKNVPPKVPKPDVKNHVSETPAAIKSEGEAPPPGARAAAVDAVSPEEPVITREQKNELDAPAYARPITESKPSPSAAPVLTPVAANIAPEPVFRSELQPRPRREVARREPKSHQASRPLQLMTLRTIEFADGHRETRLLPYRGHREVLAMDHD